MARRPSRGSQYRKDIKTLQRKGLYTPKTDDVTSYGKKQIRKFADVLAGRASVVKTTEIAARRYNRQGFRTHGDKVVISQPPSTRPHFSKITRQITVNVKLRGKVRRSEIHPMMVGGIDKLREIDTKKFYLSLPLQRYGSRSLDYMNYEDADELIRDVTEYTRNPDLLNFVIKVPRDGMVPRSGKSPFPHAVRGTPRV